MGLILPLAWAIFRERSKLTQIHFLTEYTLAVALSLSLSLSLSFRCLDIAFNSLSLKLLLLLLLFLFLQVLPTTTTTTTTTKWVFYSSPSLTFGSTSKIQVWRVSEVTSHTLYPNGKVQIRSQTVEREKRREEEKRKRGEKQDKTKRKTLVK